MDVQPWIKRVEWEPEHDSCSQKRAIDELVAENVSIHIERLDTGLYWMGITGPDGERQVVTFGTRRGALIVARTEAD